MASILRLPSVLHKTGDSRSSHYAKISKGLMTEAVRLGARSVGWPEHELDAILKYRIAGRSETEIRQLVAQLHTARKAAA